MQLRFSVNQFVSMTADALCNYGEKYRDKVFAVEHIATAYMPAREFYDKGKPSGYHPGFDTESDSALYDLKGLPMSLYDWELKAAL